MKSLSPGRRAALGLAIAAACSAGAAAPAGADVLPLNVDKTVNVGTAHIYALGQITDVPVNTSATVGIHLTSIDPLFVAALPVSCPAGQTGTLLRVLTLGSPVAGSVELTDTAGLDVYKPVSIGAIDTGLVGTCVSGTGVS